MLFNSLGYLVFLPLAVLVHWLLPHHYRVYFLAAISVGFYAMWRVDFTFLVLFSAMLDYFVAQRIAATDNLSHKRVWLVTSICIQIALLVFFKYTYFLVDNANSILSLLGWQAIDPTQWPFQIILPLGISFYTFQTISYTVDVYRRVILPYRHFPTYLTFVMFWPQLVAGPILRATEVIPQIEKHRRFDLDGFQSGAFQVLGGLFKKAVVADGVSKMVEYWFDQPVYNLTGIDVWVAAILFGIQIYCDFSGYSDMAIGSARMMGFNFPKNFNWPYMALSPKDFWQRWHISLSSWVRDYLYLPLTGQKFQTHSTGGMAVAGEYHAGEHRRNFSLLITWLIMGLWHGAAWKFVFWGLYHGAFILLYRIVKPLGRLPKRWPLLAWCLMFPIAMASWIPFRAHSMHQTLAMYAKIFNPAEYHLSPAVTGMSVRIAGYSYIWALAIPCLMTVLYFLNKWIQSRRLPLALEVLGRTAVAAAIVPAVLMSLNGHEVFIYFQF